MIVLADFIPLLLAISKKSALFMDSAVDFFTSTPTINSLKKELIMLRIGLFLLTNLAIILVASISLRLLGVDSILANNGIFSRVDFNSIYRWKNCRCGNIAYDSVIKI